MDSSGGSAQIVRFGVFETDLQSGELRKNGLKVPLQGQPFQVFAILLQHSGKLVTRDELRQRVWPEDTFVDFDHGLNTAITKIRTALGDSAENPRFVETLPRRGYRFIGPADKPMSPAPSPSALKGHLESLTARWRWIGVGVAALALVSTVAIWRLSPKSAESPSSSVEVVPLGGVPTGHQHRAAFSPDGNQLAFDHGGDQFCGNDQSCGIYTTLIDGERSLRLTNDPNDCCPRWSPDGRQIAFSRVSYEGFAIDLIPALGGSERRLYVGPTNYFARYFDWSPDGKVLAFSQGRNGKDTAWIALISLADSTIKSLTAPVDQYFDNGPVFSPDGSKIAFIRSSVALMDSDLFVVRTAGGEPKRLTFDNSDEEGAPAWTADGSEIVFSSSRRGLPTLWRISASGGTPRPVIGAGAMACCPSISRKGRELIYQNRVRNDNIWRVNLRDKAHAKASPSVLISANGRNWRPDFSPDGRRIVFESDRSGYGEIWICDSDGMNCGQLTSLHGVAGTARWSPDGRYIAFEFHPGAHSEIYVVELGGQPHLVPTLPAADNLAPSWSHDGQWIYFTSDRGDGRFQLWKVPLQGGSPIQVTTNGGVYGVESADRRFFYFSKWEVPGIWRMPIGGGEEMRILEESGGSDWYNWALGRNGIYLLNRGAQPKEAIQYFEFATGKRKTILFPDRRVDFGVAVSPDERSILYAQNDLYQESLILMKNFR